MKFKVYFYNSTKVVDLNTQTCTCRDQDAIGIPCKYVIITMQQAGHSPKSYVHDWFKTKI